MPVIVLAMATPSHASEPTTVTLTALHSGLCLGISEASLDEFAAAQQQTCTGAANQQFTYDPRGLTFTAVHSGQCLTVSTSPIAEGALIWQQQCHSLLQDWRVSPDLTDGATVIITQVNSGMCLEVLESSKADGAGVVQSACDADNPQQWVVGVVR